MDVTSTVLHGSGRCLIQDMRSGEGNAFETWTVKRLHTGAFGVQYKGPTHDIYALCRDLQELERGDHVPLPPDVMAQVYFALEALDSPLGRISNGTTARPS